MTTHATTDRGEVERLIEQTDGVLAMDPAWVARDWLPAGRRLGLPDDAYDVGERGTISERWIASTTPADNRVGPDDEGLSHVRRPDGGTVLLADVVAAAPDTVLGSEYARGHAGLGRLAKIYDFAARIPFHIHPREADAARAGRRSKDEAYYYPPDVPLGPHPETFLGLHPEAARGPGREDRLLRYLQDWDSDDILQHAPAYLNVPGEGFFVPSGVLHAPGTALTLELQEDSDTLAMFQALNAGRIISKDLLFKDVSEADRAERGERAPLSWVDWEENGDPYFHENHRLSPQPCVDEDGVREEWIFFGSTKFSGKRLTVAPGSRHVMRHPGPCTLLVWSGRGTVAGRPVVGGTPGEDELLLVHGAATTPHEVVNEGPQDLVLITFLGPDLAPEAPRLPRR